MLAAFSRQICHSRLLSLRCLVTDAARLAPADHAAPAPADNAAPAHERKASYPTLGEQRRPAWWEDKHVNAKIAYRIILNRFKVHGSQREENYRQLIMRVRTPADATLALRMLDLARKERAVLQQHAPFTFHTSQLFITTCVAVKAFDVALEALQRAQEIGLQFFRADAYYSVMKSAVVNKRLDLAIQVFESMKENGVRPGGKVVHNLIMGSIINGRMDLAQAYAEEFRVNGVKINNTAQEWLDGIRSPNDNQDPADALQEDQTDETPSDQEKETVMASA